MCWCIGGVGVLVEFGVLVELVYWCIGGVGVLVELVC